MAYLTSNNPRLLRLLDSFYKDLPDTFIDNHLVPYVSIDQANDRFLEHEIFKNTHGVFSYAINEKTLLRDIQYWIGIYRLLSFAKDVLHEKAELWNKGYRIFGGFQVKFTRLAYKTKTWIIDYNKIGSTVFIAYSESFDFPNLTTLKDLNAFFAESRKEILNDNLMFREKELSGACEFAKTTVKKMLRRFKEISSDDEYIKAAPNIVIPCAF